MLKIAEMRGDVMGRFQNALYLGDVREQVGMLLSIHTRVCAQLVGLLAHNLLMFWLETAYLASLCTFVLHSCCQIRCPLHSTVQHSTFLGHFARVCPGARKRIRQTI